MTTASQLSSALLDAVDGASIASAGITGAGITVGIISDSFNNLAYETAPAGTVYDTYADDVANGFLPADIQYIDQPANASGVYAGTDEGRAMAEIVHAIAPGATLVFASSGNSSTSFALAVQQLKAAGADIIVDDIRTFDEPIFQVGGPLDNTISTYVNGGGDYFTASMNDGSEYLEVASQALTESFAGVGVQTVATFGDAPYAVAAPSASGKLQLQYGWDEPSSLTGGLPAQTSFSFLLFDATTGEAVSPSDYGVSGAAGQSKSTIIATGLNPDDTYALVAIVESGPAPSSVRLTVLNGGGTLASATAGGSYGDLYGHALVPGVNVVGASSLDAIGQSQSGGGSLANETFSEYGPGEILFGPDGQMLTIPQEAQGVTFTAPDGPYTSVTGFAPFFGTSAAAPAAAAVAALLLQENPNLTPTQVTAILNYTAGAVSTPVQGGAGLIDTQAAVSLAKAYLVVAAGTQFDYVNSSTIAGADAAPSFAQAFGSGTSFGSESATLSSDGILLLPAEDGNGSLIVAGGTETLLPSGYGSVFDLSNGDTVTAGSTAATVYLQNDTAFLGSEAANLVYAGGADSVTAGSGAMTVFGGAAGATVTGGSGGLFFGGGEGAVSVAGGSGDVTAYGGTGAADSVLIAGNGNSTLIGGSGTGASTILGGGSSRSTLVAFANGSGATVVQGASAVASLTVNGTTGSGQQLVVGPGAGNSLIALNNAADTVMGGGGNMTVVGGSGPDLYGFFAGMGGTEAIYGFKTGDALAFSDPTAIAAESVISGSDVIQTTSGALIEIVGLDHTLFS